MHGTTSQQQNESGSGAGLTNAGVGIAKTMAKGSIKKFFASPLMWARLVGRGTQFVFALIVVASYGARVNRDRREGNDQAAGWVYALFVAGLSAITSAVFAIPFWRTHVYFLWDAFLFILWVAVFGTFARIFLPLESGEDEYQGASIAAMKVAVWLDLVNCILWLDTAIYGFVYGWTTEKGKGFGRLFARKATGKIGDLENNATGKFNDKFGHKIDERLVDNPIAKGVAGKVGNVVKNKAAAKIASRI